MNHLTFKQATSEDLKINTKIKMYRVGCVKYYQIATIKNIKYKKFRYVSNKLVHDTEYYLSNLTYFTPFGNTYCGNTEYLTTFYDDMYVLDSQKEKIQQAMEHRALLKILRKLIDESFIW